MKRVLVACEESQRVTIALRGKGLRAFSCDILPASGGHPEWHIQQDVGPLLNDAWDMIIGFPPCTHLCGSGSRWWSRKQADGRQALAMQFFMNIANARCPHIAIENPVGIMGTAWRKSDQTFQPWQFGHGEVKRTCLWLKGLPPLKPTKVVGGRVPVSWLMADSKGRSVKRSKTYPGVARAMATQWGTPLKNGKL